MSTWTGICVIVGYFVILGAGLFVACAILSWLTLFLVHLPWRKFAEYLGLVEEEPDTSTCTQCRLVVTWPFEMPEEWTGEEWACPCCGLVNAA